MSAATSSVNDVSVGKADLKFEAVVIPGSDVDRAKAFYARARLATRR